MPAIFLARIVRNNARTFGKGPFYTKVDVLLFVLGTGAKETRENTLAIWAVGNFAKLELVCGDLCRSHLELKRFASFPALIQTHYVLLSKDGAAFDDFPYCWPMPKLRRVREFDDIFGANTDAVLANSSLLFFFFVCGVDEFFTQHFRI